MAKSMGSRKTTKEPPKKYLCPYCNQEKSSSGFYVSSDPLVLTGVTSICKECAEKIARGYDEKTGNFSDVTKQSLCNALERMDKPFLEKLYESSFSEVHDESLIQPKKNLWAAYIKNVQMPQYRALRWRDGDLFKEHNVTTINTDTCTFSDEILDELDRNKNDVIKQLGYDPFEKEDINDQPLLYSQLIGYLDGDGNNDDQTRVSDCVAIVRAYLQLHKLDDMSAMAFAKAANSGQTGELKNYLDSKKKIADMIKQLAEQSCISMKHTKNATKGENTWTGKIKKLKDLNLREAEVNGFDIGTCRGMQQVLEMSDASIMKQLNLDESEWSEVVAEQRTMLIGAQNERDLYKEINRLLLKENLDLRDVLEENNLLNEENLKDLNQLFSVFSDYEKDSEESEDNV